MTKLHIKELQAQLAETRLFLKEIEKQRDSITAECYRVTSEREVLHRRIENKDKIIENLKKSRNEYRKNLSWACKQLHRYTGK